MEKFINVETQSVRASIPSETASLEYRLREKARQRIVLDSGEQVALLLPRGTILKNGDVIASASGRLLRIFAAPEPVSTVLETDIRQLTRIAWHLGNRHVRLQVGASWVRYQSDHVLDDMVRRLGSLARCHLAPFEPEPGAYHEHSEAGHSHSHRVDGKHDVHHH